MNIKTSLLTLVGVMTISLSLNALDYEFGAHKVGSHGTPTLSEQDRRVVAAYPATYDKNKNSWKWVTASLPTTYGFETKGNKVGIGTGATCGVGTYTDVTLKGKPLAYVVACSDGKGFAEVDASLANQDKSKNYIGSVTVSDTVKKDGKLKKIKRTLWLCKDEC